MKRIMFRWFIALMIFFCVSCFMTVEVIADEVMEEVTIETTLAPLSKDTSLGKFEEEIIREDVLEEDRKLSSNVKSVSEEKDVNKDDIKQVREVPQTGDTSNLLIIFIALVVALVVMAVMGYLIFRKKR